MWLLRTCDVCWQHSEKAAAMTTCNVPLRNRRDTAELRATQKVCKNKTTQYRRPPLNAL